MQRNAASWRAFKFDQKSFYSILKSDQFSQNKRQIILLEIKIDKNDVVQSNLKHSWLEQRNE